MSGPRLQTIEVSVRPSGVCIIEFNRPNRGNAFNRQLCQEWNTALKWAIANENVKIIVQTGRGKYYTTGMDLSPDFATQQDPNGDRFSDLYDLLETMINSPKPLIAAVNGPSFGIGVTTLSLNDLVYSVPHATFNTPFMRWGLAAEGTSSFTFPMILGYQKAAALLIAGETLTSEELNTAGMITKIFPKDNFMEKVMEVAERMAGYSQTALFTTRELMRRRLREELHAANLREVQALRERNANNDAMPNILAFIEETKKKREAKRQKAKL